MLRRYRTICGLRGILEDARIKDVVFEYQDTMLDLAKVNAIYPDTYAHTISNWEEFERLRDEKWREVNPDSQYKAYPPSMSYPLPSRRSCVTIQIGAKVFHLDEDLEVMFARVYTEREK
jgi:hypothetical protein